MVCPAQNEMSFFSPRMVGVRSSQKRSVRKYLFAFRWQDMVFVPDLQQIAGVPIKLRYLFERVHYTIYSGLCPINRSASMAAVQPEPAAVTA